MEKRDSFTLILAGCVVMVLMFQGFIIFLKQALNKQPKTETVLTDTLAQDQKRHMQDIKDRQKRLMEDQKQRMKDLTSRNR